VGVCTVQNNKSQENAERRECENVQNTGAAIFLICVTLGFVVFFAGQNFNMLFIYVSFIVYETCPFYMDQIAAFKQILHSTYDYNIY
jgi:hypothetical protein